jgi:hypothetical protein
MKSIWYFVGLTLSVMGALVLVAGIMDFIRPPAIEHQTTLASTHPALWWGALMVVVGVAFLLREKKQPQ